MANDDMTTTNLNKTNTGLGPSSVGSKGYGGMDTQSRKHHDRPSRSQGMGSSDDAKQRVHDLVANAIGTIAGAVEGFVDTMKETELADRTKEAIELAGETVTNVTRTSIEQAKRIRDAAGFEGGGHGFGGMGSKDTSYGSSPSSGLDDLGSKGSGLPSY